MAPSIACGAWRLSDHDNVFVEAVLSRGSSRGANGLSCRELQSGGVLFFMVASERASARSGSRYLYNREVGVDVFLSEWVANTEMRKHRICRILHACSRSVKFAGRFRSKLGKQITIGNVCYRTKN